MRIVSDDALLLDEVFNDLKNEDIKLEKSTKKVDGAMGTPTDFLAILSVGIGGISAVIAYLTYRLNQKNSFVHIKYKKEYKGGVEIKLENLTKEERKEKENEIKAYWNELEYIALG